MSKSKLKQLKQLLREVWLALQKEYQAAAAPDSFLQIADQRIGRDSANPSSSRSNDRIPIQRGVVRPRRDFSHVELHDCIFWAGHWVPISVMQHALTLGSPGSGKTLHGTCTFTSTTLSVRSRRGRKLIVFDTKGDYRRILEGIHHHWEIPLYYRVLNVSDLYASGWDIVADFNDYARLYDLGFLLFPPIQGENAFFQDAARAILIAVMSSFLYRHGPDLTMADLYNALTSDLPTIEEIIRGFPRGEDIIYLLLKTDAKETLDNIRMTLYAQIQRLQIPAAHSQNVQGGLISLREFLESPDEQILVISQDLTAKTASEPIIQAAFKRLIDFINARNGVEIEPNTFIFLDELEFLGKLPGLKDAVNFARGKGLILFLLSQTVEGLHSVYGKDVAEGILSACPFKAFFRSDSLITAQWVQNLIGQREVWESQWSTSFGSQGTTISHSRKRQLEYPILSSDLRKLPQPSLETGLTGIFISKEYGDEFWKSIQGEELSQLIPPNFEFSTSPLEPAHQIIKQWSPAERAKYVSGCSKTSAPEPSSEEIAQPILALFEFEQEFRKQIFSLLKDQALPVIEEAIKARINRKE